MSALAPVLERTRAAYHAAADSYDHSALSFWDRFGRATIDRLVLRPGANVLDVCCGSGASAIPAARAVGPTGRVLGVDLAPGLIDLARAKAGREGLRQARFAVGDFHSLPEPLSSFDAVVCVFGIFFTPDMPAAVSRLWEFVRPGGRLALTTWGPRVFEPANSAFWNAIRAVRPELYKGFNPWDRISTPEAVVDLLHEGGARPAAAAAVTGTHPLRSADDWWTIVLGSGYRGIVEQLTPAQRARVQAQVRAEVRGVEAIETNVVYAVARKP